MTDRRLQDMDEDVLADTIRGLPVREPDPNLRTRVLSASPVRAHRRRRALRPALAAALVVALFLIDVIVLRLQDGSVPTARSGEVAAAASGRAADADAAWLAQVSGEAAPARIAWLQPNPSVDASSYWELRASLLANGTGG